MFQLIGSLLAFFAIVSAIANAPLAGAVKDQAAWDSLYQAPFSR